MATPGKHTLEEILSQPEVWAAVLEAARGQAGAWQAFLARQPEALTLCYGCGSTHYLAMTVAAAWQTLTGGAARAVPSGDLFFFPETWLPAQTPLRGLALSRSGTTTETLWAAGLLAERYGAALACVTCYPDTPLAGQSAFTLVSPQGQEESVAQTRSFSSMLVGSLALAGLAAPQPGAILDQLTHLPAAGAGLLLQHEPLAQQLGQDKSISRVFFLGSGPRYGLANEAMLKLKEMSLTAAEAYHPLEFRHGPKAMVDGETLVIGLLSETAREAEVAVLRDMKALGGRVLALGEAVDDLDFADYRVSFDSKLPELAGLPLYLPVLQLFAFHRSISKGLNPDSPPNLSAVIYL